jgi:hypothetical protein
VKELEANKNVPEGWVSAKLCRANFGISKNAGTHTHAYVWLAVVARVAYWWVMCGLFVCF